MDQVTRITRMEEGDDASRRSSSSSPKSRIDLKIVIMGHGGVGKTSFINRYIHNDFAETVSTIGASFVLKKWKNFYLGIWDTAGQERFTKISNFYCRGAQAAILAYDITDRDSFHALDNYVRHLADADRECIIVLIGTKTDLVITSTEGTPTLERRVSTEEAYQYAKQIGAMAFYETSAKENMNVSSVFDRIGYQCFASKLSNDEVPRRGNSATDAPLSTSSPLTTLSDTAQQRTCCNIQ